MHETFPTRRGRSPRRVVHCIDVVACSRILTSRLSLRRVRGRRDMSSTPEASKYAIAAVSKLTGVSCHALRVWERRYGFPVPQRSASGHRRYTRDQVSAIRTISARSQTGRPIGELIAEYREGRLADVEPATE